MWANVSRPVSRPADDRPGTASRRAASPRARQPKRLNRLELDLPDGRYLLAYGRVIDSIDTSDA